MVIYKTTYTVTGADIVTWQASQTEASKARGLLKKLGHKPETETVNIPTAKGPLIEWLNGNATT